MVTFSVCLPSPHLASPYVSLSEVMKKDKKIPPLLSQSHFLRMHFSETAGFSHSG